MARPNKATVEYFPHYVDHGKTLYNLEAIYGNDGYAFWFKILELLGKTENHYYDCNEIGEWRYLLSYTKFSEEKANEVLKLLAELKAIDYEMWEYKIIFSEKFIDNLQQLYSRRGITPYTKDTLKELLHTKTILKEVNVNICSQSKEKKSKEKKSKVKESTLNAPSSNDNEVLHNVTITLPKQPYGEFENVLLTEDEHKKVLARKYGDKAIEKLSAYLASKKTTYKSHYAVLNSWVFNSVEEEEMKKTKFTNGFQKEVKTPNWYDKYEKELKDKNRPKEKVSVDLEALEKLLDETFKTQK